MTECGERDKTYTWVRCELEPHERDVPHRAVVVVTWSEYQRWLRPVRPTDETGDWC